MKTIVLSYSLTGNNETLAKNLAAAINAEHVSIVEKENRTMRKTIFDILLNRKPPIQCTIDNLEKYDLVLFVGPVWIGQIATPFRACFKRIRPHVDKYAFISISGGADGPNPKIASELKARLKQEPLSVIDLHIADLLPAEPKPRRCDTSAYRINESEAGCLTGTVLSKLFDVIKDQELSATEVP